MILFFSAAFAATVQVVAPSGRVLAEQPLTEDTEAVFVWRGDPWKLDVTPREQGGWEGEIGRWEGGRAVGGSLFAIARSVDGCSAMPMGRSRDALTVVIVEGAAVAVPEACFDAPVPFAPSIARLTRGRWEPGQLSPALRVDGRTFALLAEGSQLDWRVEDADGVEWVAQVGVTTVGEAGLDAIVAWRRADPVLLWRPTITVAATLPYGEAVTVTGGPVALALKAEAPR